MQNEQALTRVDLYADAIHDISRAIRESGATPSQKSRTLKGIEATLGNLYTQLQTPALEGAA